VIQGALDAAAAGDSVLVGPGRFDDFRVATTLDGFTFSSIAHLKKADIVLIGSGMDQTIVGPETLVVQVGGLNATCLVVDEVAGVSVHGLHFENAQFPVNLKFRSVLEDCRVNNAGTNYALDIIEGDQVEIRGCQFYGRSSIITSSAAVIRPLIEDCVFENLGLDTTSIVVGNGATEAMIRGCSFIGYAASVETSLGGTATIEDSHFSQVRVNAIDLSSGSMIVRRCVIEAGSRFPLRAGLGRLEVYDTIIGGGTMATLLTWTDVTMRNCHLLNGGALTVDSRGSAARVNDLRFNWWGSSDLEQIEGWISQLEPNVIHEPILYGPVATQRRSLSSLKALFGGHD
jgi:hypothetical protein